MRNPDQYQETHAESLADNWPLTIFAFGVVVGVAIRYWIGV